ncbi:hypothetical protein Q1695_003227 [Nippostrongylus brasiliensis]|nr:hypothetical protein Q1695_003227 [Nippostrongylus brasiliensis]
MNGRLTFHHGRCIAVVILFLSFYDTLSFRRSRLDVPRHIPGRNTTKPPTNLAKNSSSNSSLNATLQKPGNASLLPPIGLTANQNGSNSSNGEVKSIINPEEKMNTTMKNGTNGTMTTLALGLGLQLRLKKQQPQLLLHLAAPHRQVIFSVLQCKRQKVGTNFQKHQIKIGKLKHQKRRKQQADLTLELWY